MALSGAAFKHVSSLCIWIDVYIYIHDGWCKRSRHLRLASLGRVPSLSLSLSVCGRRGSARRARAGVGSATKRPITIEFNTPYHVNHSPRPGETPARGFYSLAPFELLASPAEATRRSSARREAMARCPLLLRRRHSPGFPALAGEATHSLRRTARHTATRAALRGLHFSSLGHE